MESNRCVSALIVAPPGPLRDGLQALLVALPQVAGIEVASDVPAGVDRRNPGCGPVLVVLEVDRNQRDVWMTVRRARARWPQARCILLVNDVKQSEEGEAAGADAVLLKGFPPAKLIATVVKLLPQGTQTLSPLADRYSG